MTDTDYLEPKNGDFIAYIDKLQQESIDALKIANADRIAHANEMRSSSLRDIASELMKRRPSSESLPGSDNPSSSASVPTAQHSQSLSVKKRPTVAEEFKILHNEARENRLLRRLPSETSFSSSGSS